MSRSRWARGVLVLIVVLAAGGGIWTFVAESEAAGEVVVLNPEGESGTALVVYHPGLSGYVPEVVGAFADGLLEEGWRVERVPAGARAPTDLSRYELLVLGSPTYWWTPARPVSRYVERVGNLEGKPVAVVVTASGQVERSRALLEGQVRDAGGELVLSLPLTVWRPNVDGDPRPNEEVARELAGRAGREVAAGLGENR